MDLALLEQGASRLSCRERQVFGLGIGEADDLVAPFELPPPPVGDVDLALVAPDADELLDHRAVEVAPDVAAAVRPVAHEDEARVVDERIVARPIAAEGAGDGNRADQFVVDEGIDRRVVGVGERPGEMIGAIGRQDDRAGDRVVRLGEGIERGVHRVVVGAVELNDGQARGVADEARRLHRVDFAVEAEQHLGPAVGLDTGDGDRLLDLPTGDDDDAQPAAVDRPHRRARQVRRARLLAHGHAVRHLEVVAVERRALVGAEEDARHRDVARRREGLGARSAFDRTLEAHQVEELVRRRAGGVAAHRVHRGEDGTDAFAGDRPGKDEVDADAARPELEAELARQGVERRLGDGIGGPAVIMGAAEDRRDVDDRSALGHRRGGGADHVPRDPEDVARRVADRLGVGAAVGLELGQVGGRQRQAFERLLRPGRPGVVDEDVEPAVAGENVGDARAARRGRGPVHDDAARLGHVGPGVGERGSHRRASAFRRPPREDDRRPLAQIMPRDLAAEIARRAGDERHLTRETAGAREGEHRGIGGLGVGAGLGGHRVLP